MFCPFWNKCNLLNLNVDLCFDSGKVAGLLISNAAWTWMRLVGGNLYNMEFCDIFSSSRVEFNKSICVSLCEETNLYEALDGLSWNSQLLQEEATRFLELITGNLPINWLLHHSMQTLILELHQILKKSPWTTYCIGWSTEWVMHLIRFLLHREFWCFPKRQITHTKWLQRNSNSIFSKYVYNVGDFQLTSTYTSTEGWSITLNVVEVIPQRPILNQVSLYNPDKLTWFCCVG